MEDELEDDVHEKNGPFFSALETRTMLSRRFEFLKSSPDGKFYPSASDIYGAKHGFLHEGWEEVKEALPIVWTQYVNTGGVVGRSYCLDAVYEYGR